MIDNNNNNNNYNTADQGISESQVQELQDGKGGARLYH
jgi:hypothetical protein